MNEETLVPEIRRLLAILEAFPSALLDIDVDDGRPVRVTFQEPQALRGMALTLDAEEIGDVDFDRALGVLLVAR